LGAIQNPSDISGLALKKVPVSGEGGWTGMVPALFAFAKTIGGGGLTAERCNSAGAERASKVKKTRGEGELGGASRAVRGENGREKNIKRRSGGKVCPVKSANTRGGLGEILSSTTLHLESR